MAGSAVSHEIQLAVRIGGEAAQAPWLDISCVIDDVLESGRRALRVDLCRPHARDSKIREKVPATHPLAQTGSSVDIAAGHRVAFDQRHAGRVEILVGRAGQRQERRRRRDVSGNVSIEVIVRAFQDRPSVVASSLANRLVVDFFPAVLANIRDHQRARSTERGIVEDQAPGIAYAEGPDLRQRCNRYSVAERIVERDAVALRIAVRYVDVDAKDLSLQLHRILRVPVGIAGFRRRLPSRCRDSRPRRTPSNRRCGPAAPSVR